MISKRQVALGALGAGLYLLAGAASAHAHGGMANPDELGPPIMTSAALGFVCYWLVVLWPARRRDDASKTSVEPARGGRHTRGGRRRVSSQVRHLRDARATVLSAVNSEEAGKR